MVLAARNYDPRFGRLGELESGDRVIFTDMDDNIFKYSVVAIGTLNNTAVEEMNLGGWDLTLFTRTRSGRARATIRFELVFED